MLCPHRMSPDERRVLEQQADKLMRRGDLPGTAATLRRLVEAFPEEPSYVERLADVEASLDPSERSVRMPPPRPTGENAGPLHEAEALAAAGRYAEAVAIYRALLAATPDAPLLKERLAELYALAQVAAPKRPAVNRSQVLEHLLERITSRRRS